MKLVNIPIEPIEERYSVQWDRWFLKEFEKADFNSLVTVYGKETSGKVSHGLFLDVIETNKYKTEQLAKIIEHITPEDRPTVLFFHDLWFPGLINIAYIRDGLGLKNLRICGCLHAGSYTPHDFLNTTGMGVWAGPVETGWFSGIVDKIFVATHYHKNLVCSTRDVNPETVKVTGFPIYPEFQKQAPRENIIVFPHLGGPEKQPEMFYELQEVFTLPTGWRWCSTKEEAKTKTEYYNLLNKARIVLSFSLLETWGIAMLEAVLCGAIPLCPHRLSYPELYFRDFLYDGTVQGIIPRIQNIIESPRQWDRRMRIQKDLVKHRGEIAIPNMIENIKGLLS